MAGVYAREILGVESPRVGMVSIGEEAIKGTDLVKGAAERLKADPQVNFIGNVEGRDLFRGAANVVVCDGFVGNVVLKLSEGLAEGMVKMLKEEMLGSLASKVGLLFNRRTFKKFLQRVDYAEYGGAPILGIKGVGIVCHGASSVKAIKNAVRMAHDFAKEKIQDKLSEQIVIYEGLKAQGIGRKT